LIIADWRVADNAAYATETPEKLSERRKLCLCSRNRQKVNSVPYGAHLWDLTFSRHRNMKIKSNSRLPYCHCRWYNGTVLEASCSNLGQGTVCPDKYIVVSFRPSRQIIFIIIGATAPCGPLPSSELPAILPHLMPHTFFPSQPWSSHFPGSFWFSIKYCPDKFRDNLLATWIEK
jgi:hypothetical protein